MTSVKTRTFDHALRDNAKQCLNELLNNLHEVTHMDTSSVIHQVDYTFDLVLQGDVYGARMSLFQVQNQLSQMSAIAGNSKGNIGSSRALLRCWDSMSRAGRPMGHCLDAHGAVPYKSKGVC